MRSSFSLAGHVGARLLSAAALEAIATLLLPRVATNLIVVDEKLAPAELIFVFNGKATVRGEHAARLFHAQLAPVVLIAQTEALASGDGSDPGVPLSEAIERALLYSEVPQSAVDVIPYPGGVANTVDEARALRRYLERQPVHRVIVVTTDHHSGRARRALRQELRGLEVELRLSAAPDNTGITPSTWWRNRAGIRIYITELAKQVGTLLRLDGT